MGGSFEILKGYAILFSIAPVAQLDRATDF